MKSDPPKIAKIARIIKKLDKDIKAHRAEKNDDSALYKASYLSGGDREY